MQNRIVNALPKKADPQNSNPLQNVNATPGKCFPENKNPNQSQVI
jgi:hypothetical protein